MLHTRGILFIDDTGEPAPSLLAWLADESPQWSIVRMDDVETALAYAGQSRLDAIFLNLRLDAADGVEVLRTLSEMEAVRGVPVVAYAVELTESLKREALTLGAADLMDGPVHETDLRVRIRNVLALKASQDETAFMVDCAEAKSRQRTTELEIACLDALWRLAKACEYRDSDMGDHVLRVGHCCRIVAETLGEGREFVESIFATSPLHDIGKIGIPDSILLKSGPLTPDEFAVMARHCEIGANILLDAPKDTTFVSFKFRGRAMGAIAGESNKIKRMASMIAMSHHEWWDGSGYPHGLGGEAIPLAARIVAIADVYDAVRSVRPYKEPQDHATAMRVIRGGEGTHFDPDVVAAFEASLDRVREIFATLSIDEGPPSATSAA